MALLSETTIAILLGIGFGTGARIYMLRTDYRSYPTYLHGRIIHILAGFIASALGAVLLPAIVNQDYTAVTFFYSSCFTISGCAQYGTQYTAQFG